MKNRFQDTTTALALSLGILLLLLFLTGCRRPKNRISSEKPGTLVFARGSDAMKLDPADVDDGESVNTLSQVMEGLIRFRRGTLDIEPALATSWEVSPDGITYTFHLRPDVRFHDGTPLDAESALFSFRRQMDENHPAHFPEASFQYWGNLYDDITAVRVVDKMTIEFTLGQPNATILYSLASFPAWLISPKSLDDYGTELQRNPVGTGPFRFVSWKPNQAIIFERNEDYWGEPAGFDRLVIRPIPDNTIRLLELKSGKVHGLDGLAPAELTDLENDPAFRIHRHPGMNVGYMAFSSFVKRLQPPEVRHAISMAIDRKAIVRLALKGYGLVAQYPLPPGFLGEPPASVEAPIHYDPRKAREILARYPDVVGQPINLHTISAPRPYFPDPAMIASLIRSDLEKAGLTVNIITKDFKSHLHDSRRGDFDLCLLGWSGDNGDPDNFLATFFASWAAVMGAANNISFYKNPEMDALLLAGRKAVSLEERQRIYEDVLAVWARDLPLVPLVHTEQIVVMRKEVSNFILSKTGTHYLGPVNWATPAP